MAALFRLEQTPTQQAMDQVLVNLSEWLADRADLQRLVVGWLEAHLINRGSLDEVADKVANLKEMRIMLSERLEQWKQEFRAEGVLEGLRKGQQEGLQKGLQEGRQEGRQEGEQHSLLRLLKRKFGEPPAAIAIRISQAALPELERWFDRGLDAKTLDDVFADDDAVH